MAGKAAAAVAEVDGSSITVEWRGLTLELPAEVPPVVLFDVVEYEAEENPLVMFRLLRALLGGEQFVEVRNTLSGGDDGEVVGELFERIFDKYGVDPGEASASPTSS